MSDPLWPYIEPKKCTFVTTIRLICTGILYFTLGDFLIIITLRRLSFLARNWPVVWLLALSQGREGSQTNSTPSSVLPTPFKDFGTPSPPPPSSRSKKTLCTNFTSHKNTCVSLTFFSLDVVFRLRCHYRPNPYMKSLDLPSIFLFGGGYRILISLETSWGFTVELFGHDYLDSSSVLEERFHTQLYLLYHQWIDCTLKGRLFRRLSEEYPFPPSLQKTSHYDCHLWTEIKPRRYFDYNSILICVFSKRLPFLSSLPLPLSEVNYNVQTVDPSSRPSYFLT